MSRVIQSAGKSSVAKPTAKISNGKRLSVSLSDDAASLLDFLAESQGITQNEAIRRAIATEAYFFKERINGTKILFQKSDKEIREVIFR